MELKDILLSNLDQVFGADGDFQPTNELLDEIWKHILELETTLSRQMLMSDVIDGDSEIDDLLIAFAADGGIDNALKLRQRAQKLFRDWAYKAVEDYESDARALLRERPE